MNIDKAAVELARHRRSRIALPALPPDLRPENPDRAYDVQDLVHRVLEPDIGPRTGYKIGCTTKVMRTYLGIPSPCSGGIFARTTHESGVTLRPADFVRVGIECEIAVRLAHDIDPREAGIAAADLRHAIAAYMPAIEVVDDRYEDWRTIGTPTLIADDFFAAGCVLGTPVDPSDTADLATMVGRTLVNDVEVGRGMGSEVMGHPYAALAWLADHLARRGSGLRAGDVVLTGSLVQTVWLEPGDAASVSISGLGDVALELRRP